MATEVVLSASNTDNTIYVWDIRSGSSLFSFKQSISPVGGLAVVPKPGASFQVGSVVTAQSDRAILNVYQWQRDQVMHKMTTAEKMVSVAASHQGQYLAGATAKGKLYLWHIATGHLLRVFDAHYRRITRIVFSNDDSTLLTASEDASVNVWLVSSLVGIDTDHDVTARPSPLYSWSDHTLAVSDIYVGHGLLSGTRVCTSSLDHTVKLWDLATGQLLTTFLFPKAVSNVIMNPSETTLFAVCEDKIYAVDMYRHREDQLYKITTTDSMGGMGRVESVGIKSSNMNDKEASLGVVYSGHIGHIHSITLSFDGTLLISGGADGDCIVWDVLSRQPLRKFTLHKGPISHVSCFLRPLELSSSNQTMVAMPWQQLKRTIMTLEDEHKNSSQQLMYDTHMDIERHQQLVQTGPLYATASNEYRLYDEVKDIIQKTTTDDPSVKLEHQISQLQSDLNRMNEYRMKSKLMTNELHNIMVDSVMNKRRNKRKIDIEDDDDDE